MSVAVLWSQEDGLRLLYPLLVSRVSAGFPSPADDWIEGRIDLNSELVRHPDFTFLLRVIGDSMDDDIKEGDVLIVDRACEAEDEDIVIARVADEFTVKKLKLEDGRMLLLPTNEAYPPIEVTGEMDVEIWGTVTWSLRKHK